MCFSAEASFTAAAALAIMGILTVRNYSSNNYIFLALIPLLFALQQFSEGILWLNFNANRQPDFITYFAQRSFLIFAFFLWPIWIPLSLGAVEKVVWRRNIIYFILACGLGLSFLNLSYALSGPISISIINHSIHYSGKILSQEIIYPLIILIPVFMSSMKKVWIFGVLIAIAYGIADYYYQETFVSVWCFFAAMISLILYKVLRDNQAEETAFRAKE